MAEFPAVDLRHEATALDLRDDDAFEFRLVKQRFAETFLKLDLVGRTRGLFQHRQALAQASHDLLNQFGFVHFTRDI
jgi:hypothetical protein